MKRLNPYFLIIIFILCLPLSVRAQTEMGKILLGGNTGFSVVSTKNKELTANTYSEYSKSKSLKLTPQVGFFIANNVVIGLEVRYEKDELKQSSKTYTSSSFYLIPMAQIYFSKDVMKPYIYGGVGTGNTSNDFTYSPDNNEAKLTLYEVGLGVATFVNKSVSIEIQGSYSSVTSKYDDNYGIEKADKINGIGFQIGIVVCL